jgi:DNA polymerase-3 subunit epsilon
MREIIFDTETTGLDPKTGDRMVEIGCIEMIARVETGRTFHAFFNPERDMPVEAERVHGLSAAFLATKPRFAEVAAEAEVLELNEGDVVFFPARWWHQVDTTSALSCSVGCRYV